MMPDFPRLFYPCRYAYRVQLEHRRRHETAFPDTNRRNGLASIDTMKCGRN